MLGNTSQIQKQIIQLVDAILICISFLLALVLHKLLFWLFPDVFAQFDMFTTHTWLYVPIIIVWLVTLDITGVYSRISLDSPHKTALRILRANFLAVIGLLAFLYAFRVYTIPRSLLILNGIVAMVLISIRSFYIRVFLRHAIPSRHVIFVGDYSEAKQVYEWLLMPAYRHAYAPIGLLTHTPVDEIDSDFSLPIIGTPVDLENQLHKQPVDGVIIIGKGFLPKDIHQLISTCEVEGIEVWLSTQFLSPSIAQIEFGQVDNHPFLIYSSLRKPTWALLTKRAFDIVSSAVALVVLSPLFLGITIAIRSTSPGPAFFSQIRCTRRGRTFKMYKFRTMVQDAESLLPKLSSQNEVSGPVFKIKNDPRVTPVGRWLRRYSLDELPQLVNVLKGDMSIVGPRPPIPAEVKKYENWQRRRLSMRSGCTCLWQCGGRNNLGFEEWMRLDLKYIDTWSLWLDFKIILKTVAAVFRGTGC